MSKKKRKAKEDEKARKKEQKKAKVKRRRRKLFRLLVLLGGGAVVANALSKAKVTPGSGKVELKDEEPNGLSSMIAQLLETYMQEPKKKAIADQMNTVVSIQDITQPDLATSIRFRGSDITVENGVAPDAQIYIGTELGLLLGLSGAGKGLQMLKFLQTEEGKNLVKAFKEGRFKIKGVLAHPGQMMKFQALLTPEAE